MDEDLQSLSDRWMHLRSVEVNSTRVQLQNVVDVLQRRRNRRINSADAETLQSCLVLSVAESVRILRDHRLRSPQKTESGLFPAHLSPPRRCHDILDGHEVVR